MWTTDGTPYQYRLATRYEIPAPYRDPSPSTAPLPPRRGPGQRDHSWGVRDWWSMDWIWSALHLDDGTHLHGVNIKIPGVPPFSIGYVQDARRHGHRAANHRSGASIRRGWIARRRDAGGRARRYHRDRRRARPCAATPGRPGRAGQPIPTGVGHRDHRRRANRRGLAGVEP